MTRTTSTSSSSRKMTTAALVCSCMYAISVDAFSSAPKVPARPTPSVVLKTMSFNEESKVLASCDLPGNFGFDPLHLAQSQEQLITYRKAEMKHARLAMLAVMVILWQDLHVVDKLGVTPFFEGRAFPEFVGAAIGLPMALELYGESFDESHQGDRTYFPGNLDLDPFHLYPSESTGQRRMQFAEVMTGRVAMVTAAGTLTRNLLESLGFDTEETGSVFYSWLFPSVQTTTETLEEVLA